MYHIATAVMIDVAATTAYEISLSFVDSVPK